MFKEIVRFLLSKSREEAYKPMPHTFFRVPEIAKQLHEQGYYIADFINEKECKQLLEVYQRHEKKEVYEVQFDQQNPEKNGAYMGVISKNVHDSINQILKPTFDKWFVDYYSAVNAFAVKTSGNAGKVPIHQDVSDLDELRYSTISIWLPLQDMSSENGTLQVVPRSHFIFLPYRASTINPYTKNIESEIMPYFTPLYLKAGQALLFDSRLFHFSPPNLSGKNRVITLCRICPTGAPIINYYSDPQATDGCIEMWQCPDDYLIYTENHDGNQRPINGQLIKRIKANLAPLSADDFEQKRKMLGIELPTQ